MKTLKSVLILGAAVLSVLTFSQCNITPSFDEIISIHLPEMRESVGDIPLNDPDSFTYKGINSGLYAWGNALIPNAYKTDYINV